MILVNLSNYLFQLDGKYCTPSVQLLFHPAANPKDDAIAVFGMRFRATF